jgi:hypothetical protein
MSWPSASGYQCDIGVHYLSVLASDEDTGLAFSDFVKPDLLIPHDVDSAHLERLSHAVRCFRFPPGNIRFALSISVTSRTQSAID